MSPHGIQEKLAGSALNIPPGPSLPASGLNAGLEREQGSGFKSNRVSSSNRLEFGKNVGMVGVQKPDDFGVVQQAFDIAPASVEFSMFSPNAWSAALKSRSRDSRGN
ncbi:MAG: hypothetical protein ACLQVW_01900 [Limisphaerales bacterium]